MTASDSLLTNPAKPAITVAIVAGVVLLLISSGFAQTFTVLHAFTGGADGAGPAGGGLTIDRAGNFYGTTGSGGYYGSSCLYESCGVVFRMTPKGSGWIFNTLYEFTGGQDGDTPDAPVAFGPDGALYGTTYYGGGEVVGVVYSLRPSVTVCKSAICPWQETVLHRFRDNPDGGNPGFSALIFDGAGNIYGTATSGGTLSNGTAFELTRSGGGWTETVLHDFTGGYDGGSSWSGLVFDQAGNLYGTTFDGGAYEGGTVYELTPSGGSWALNVLHSFSIATDGYSAFGNLIFDQYGDLWGTNRFGGPDGAGSAYELTPSGGSWDFNVRNAFSGYIGSQASLVEDQGGNFYGTTVDGAVFKLSPSGGGWTYTVLHSFTGGSDGGDPYSRVVIDANGNLYGTAETGGITGGVCGSYGCGVVWAITP